jgi:hypothetical protein
VSGASNPRSGWRTFADVISDERAEFIAALSKAADMVKLLLRQIDLLISGYESGASADRR